MLHETMIEPDWPAPPNVRAVCTTRNGGVSLAPYDSLNLAAHVGDLPHQVQRNRQMLADALCLPSWPVWLDQQHTPDVICLDNVTNNELLPTADASFTSQTGRVCVVMTADCLPVLICDQTGSRVAAIHAGWRGLRLGIIEATVKSMAAADGPVFAWMGPAIGPAVYEINEAVRAELLAGDPGAEDAFEPTRAGHWTADLYALARRRLQSCGITAIFGGNFCTHRDSARFFSYRRDGACGRIASLIWMTDEAGN